MLAKRLISAHLPALYGPDETEVINYGTKLPIHKTDYRIYTRDSYLTANGLSLLNAMASRPVLTQLVDRAELHRCIASKVADLRSRGYNRLRSYANPLRKVQRAYESLSSIDEIKLLKSSSIEYEQGVVVIPSYLSKGIEFDAVIIYDASEQVYGDESLRRLFYTACTRAMHDLQLYSVGKPSPFLRNVTQKSLLLTYELH